MVEQGDPTEEEIQRVIAKLGEGRWIDFSARETEVAKGIVGWDDDPVAAEYTPLLRMDAEEFRRTYWSVTGEDLSDEELVVAMREGGDQ